MHALAIVLLSYKASFSQKYTLLYPYTQINKSRCISLPYDREALTPLVKDGSIVGGDVEGEKTDDHTARNEKPNSYSREYSKSEIHTPYG
jgi:hypothetical protein